MRLVTQCDFVFGTHDEIDKTVLKMFVITLLGGLPCNVHAVKVECLLKSSMILSVLLKHGSALAVVRCLIPPFWLIVLVATIPTLANR